MHIIHEKMCDVTQFLFTFFPLIHKKIYNLFDLMYNINCSRYSTFESWCTVSDFGLGPQSHTQSYTQITLLE